MMGEPYDADQAKFVPTSAQEFNSTQVTIENEMFRPRTRSTYGGCHSAVFSSVPMQVVTSKTFIRLLHSCAFCFWQVSRGLETLQRRKRRLYPARDRSCPELPRKQQQPQEADPDGDRNQVFEDNQDGEDGEAGEGAAWMVQAAEPETSHDSRGISFFSKGSSRDPPAPLRHRSSTSPARGQVLIASSRRWTLPSSNGMLPVNGMQLPLLRLLDGQGRSSGTRASQPLPKRTRGVDFWDAQLLR